MAHLLQGEERQRLEHRVAGLEAAGAPTAIATRAAGLLDQFSLLDVVEICSETGRDAGEVAPVYFATSEQFGIDGMLTRVSRLPRDDRWDALARGALRDDLYAVLEALTKSVLDASEPGQTAAERIAQWSKTNADSLDPGPHRARGHRADREPGHRGAVGGAAHPARGHPQRVGHDLSRPGARPRAALGSGPCPP